MKTKNEVKLIFKNSAQAKYFVEWLCNSGEQDYFDCVDINGSEGVKSFDYDYDEKIIVGKT